MEVKNPSPMREAGVSEGGLLYHSPSKEALIGRLIGGFEDALGQEMGRIRLPAVVCRELTSRLASPRFAGICG